MTSRGISHRKERPVAGDDTDLEIVRTPKPSTRNSRHNRSGQVYFLWNVRLSGPCHHCAHQMPCFTFFSLGALDPHTSSRTIVTSRAFIPF